MLQFQKVYTLNFSGREIIVLCSWNFIFINITQRIFDILNSSSLNALQLFKIRKLRHLSLLDSMEQGW